MTLFVDIRNGNDVIHTYAATRTDKRIPHPGWHEYLVQSCPKRDGGTGFIVGHVNHRYEDGAAVLALKVMKLVTPEDDK
jgi:hypothetical protein